MSMPAPPGLHAAGDAGHVDDHTAITAALSALETAVAALQAQSPALVAAGGNDATLAGTGTGMLTVRVSAVNRDGGVDLLDFFYGTQKIFSVNSYGEFRLTPAAAGHVAQIISVLPAQSADAFQVVSPSGAVLARIGPDGSASFAGTVTASRLVVPPTWQHCSLKFSWSHYQGRTLTVKLCPDNMCHISGHLVPDINHCADGTVIATVPAGCSPVSRPESILFGHANCTPTKIGGHFQVDTYGNITIWNFGNWQDNGNGHLVVNHRYAIDAN